MHTIDVVTADKLEGWFEHDDSVHFHGSFVLHGDNGANDSAAVVIELEPGKALGEHTDSPEEILIVMEGDVEFQIGDERQRATPGTVAVVPSMEPHNMRNVGTTPARIVGFFPSPHVVSTFVEPIQPLNIQVLVHGDASQASAAD